MSAHDETERLRPKPETPKPGGDSQAVIRPTTGKLQVVGPKPEPAPVSLGEAFVPAVPLTPVDVAPRRLSTAKKTPPIAIVADAPKTPVPLPQAPVSEAARYSILGSIHRGGMGEILLARVEGREGFARRVVLKGLLARLLEDDVSYQLFMREARLMAALDHPNIVRVFDLPYIAEKPYLAMEYVRGRNFHQVIQRSTASGRPMPARIALHVVSESLRGLHYAHNAKDEADRPMGIIHRDVSPGNILVSFFGEVKVTDFGIAKMANAPKFTGPRSIRGKARYVAPEQVHGEQASVLSDIYSAGVVLSEALLGEPLWERASVPETLLSIVSEDREKTIDRILAERSPVPGLRSALRGALSLNPRDRFASALHFAETLEAIARSIGGAPTHVDVGVYIRKLFSDAPDLPADDGFAGSGLPVPDFADLIPEPKTDPTMITLEPEWIKEHSARDTASMRAAKPRSVSPHFTPVIGDADSDFDLEEDVHEERTSPSRIRATLVSQQAAVVSEVANAVASAEYSFSELIAANSTDEEPSRDIDNVDPAELARVRGARVIETGDDSELGLRTPHGLTLLVAGIFIGASLAIAGCVLALIIGS
jgi:serine/threonine protein kinase